MFEVNGILYADEPARELEVRSARVADDHVMLVTFSTGEMRLCDRINHGILMWCDGDIDISPTHLYEHSYEYAA